MRKKATPEALLRQTLSTRNSLLLVLLFSAINLALLLVGSDTYFLFSASIPYYLTAFGMGMDLGLGADGIGTYTLITLGISVAMLLLYLVCWLQSRRHPRSMAVALVAFLLDTLVLLWLCLRMDLLVESIPDLLFHTWVILELVRFLSANHKLDKMIDAFDPSKPDDFDDMDF